MNSGRVSSSTRRVILVTSPVISYELCWHWFLLRYLSYVSRSPWSCPWWWLTSQFAITASNNSGSHDIAAKLLKMSISSHMWGLTFYSHEQNTCMTAWAHWEGMHGPMKIVWARHFLIEVTISNQETKLICIYVLGVAILCIFL